MGGRGAKGRGKGSRTIRPLFRKNTASEKERVFNRQSELLRELQIMERAMPQKIARERDPVKKMRLQRELRKNIDEKRKEISETEKILTKLILGS